MYLTLDHIAVLKQFLNLQSMSLNRINITKEYLEDLLITPSKYDRLKILYLEAICFPSFTILSQMNSLEELSLSYPCNNNNYEEYTDTELFMLGSLKKLKVLILDDSRNLSKAIRTQLKERLEEFIYNNDVEN